MSAGATTRSGTSFPPVSRSLVGTVVAFALLLQALFAMPLALRMTAGAMQWKQFGSHICAATADSGSASSDSSPVHQLPAHSHAHCLICQAHVLPLGLLAV